MLQRSKRVSTKLFDQKIKKTKQFLFDLYTIRVHLLKNGEISRFSVIVSKKVQKSAVKRNRIKRVLFETISRLQDVSPGVYFVYPKKEVLTTTPKNLHEYIKKDFASIN